MLLLVPTLPISWVESYTFLSYFSMVGLAVALCAIGAMIGYCGQAMGTESGCDPEKSACEIKVFDGRQMLGHVGLAIFIFEGNAAVYNIRAEARDKKAYPRILTSAVSTFIVIYAAFGTIGYLCFRDQSSHIFPLSFHGDNIFFQLIIVGVCFNCFISYPV